MLIKEIIQMAFQSLKANALRSILTMFGITVGVFSVIGVMTIISSLQAQVENGLNVLGSGTFQIQKYPAVNFGGPQSSKYANRPNITYEEGLRLRKLLGDEAKCVGLEVSTGGRQAVYNGIKTNPNLQVLGSDEFALQTNNYELESGRFISEEDVLYARTVCVIGAEVATKLFLSENPIGKLLKVNGKNYTIVGLAAPKGSSFGQSQDLFVIIPITKFFEHYGKRRRSLDIVVQAKSQEEYDALLDKTIGLMRVVRGLDATEENNFEFFSNESLISTFEQIAGAIRIGAFIISFIALITAGIGIMNIMLVSVTERTKEIGIRKSIGAKKVSILTQFLIEAVVLSEFGGLIGIAVGVAGGNVFAKAFDAPLVFPWDWALISILVCSVIGVGFGIYPALKAAALDPIDALRFE